MRIRTPEWTLREANETQLKITDLFIRVRRVACWGLDLNLVLSSLLLVGLQDGRQTRLAEVACVVPAVLSGVGNVL